MIYQPSGIADALAIVDDHRMYSNKAVCSAVRTAERIALAKLRNERLVGNIMTGLLETKWDWSRYGQIDHDYNNPGVVATVAIWKIGDAIKAAQLPITYASGGRRGETAVRGFCASVGAWVPPL